MGTPTWVKKWFLERYNIEINAENLPAGVVLIIDLMQILKFKPAECTLLRHLLAFIFSVINQKMRDHKFPSVVVICVDQMATDHRCNLVKKICCHTTRYKNTEFYPEEKSPYLPSTMDGQLPPEWERFCGNSNLLRRELFPLIYNCCLNPKYMRLNFGQMVVLQGFPGRQLHHVPGIDEHALRALTSGGINDPNSPDALPSAMQKLIPWEPAWLPITKDMETRDRDMYNRVYYIKAVHPGVDPRFPEGYVHSDEWKDARNNVGEADLAMVYFDKFFPDKTQILDINDGDILAISLLYAQDRFVGNRFRNRHIIALPIKEPRKKNSGPVVVEPKGAEKRKKYTYIDVEKLFECVCRDPLFGKHGVQNHITMAVLMIIIAGTDFFQGAFGGMGVDKVVWKTLTAKMDVFHHMIQCTKNVLPDTRNPRQIVMDAEAWKQFVYSCYVEKHGKAVRKKNKGKLTKRLIKAHLSKRKRETDHLPSPRLVSRWGGQVLWNLLYWMNGPRESPPDPFETKDGLPVFGYHYDDITREATYAEEAAIDLLEHDEVYTRFFLEGKRQEEHRDTQRLKRPRTKAPTEEHITRMEEMSHAMFNE